MENFHNTIVDQNYAADPIPFQCSDDKMAFVLFFNVHDFIGGTGPDRSTINKLINKRLGANQLI